MSTETTTETTVSQSGRWQCRLFLTRAEKRRRQHDDGGDDDADAGGRVGRDDEKDAGEAAGRRRGGKKREEKKKRKGGIGAHLTAWDPPWQTTGVPVTDVQAELR